MSNYHVEAADKPAALTSQALKSLRHQQVQGLSRRQLIRRAVGAGIGLWLLEISAGTIGFIWPNLASGFGGKLPIGTLDDVKAANTNLPIAEGFPAYFAQARAFVILIDPAQQRFIPGEDTTGDGHPLNVRALYQRCPAPRLQAQPVPQELLDGVPVPRVALRPPRDQGRRSAIRPGAARHGPLLHRRRR